MKLDKMRMEDWFIKISGSKFNFAESGVLDYSLRDFLRTTKTKIKEIENLSLGNNDTLGLMETRDAVASFYDKAGVDNVIITSGTSEALFIFFDIMIRKGDKVLLIMPAFPPLYLLPKRRGAKLIYFDIIKNKNNLVESLIDSIKTNRPKFIIINSPHNPTGFVFSLDEIKKIGLAAKEVDSILIFDEHYRFLSLDNDSKLLFSGYDVVSRFYKKVYAVGSIIKSIGIVGVRVGWLVGDIGTIKTVRDYKDFTTHCVPSISEKIAVIGMKKYQDLNAIFVKNIKTNWKKILNHDLIKTGKIEIPIALKGGCVIFVKVNKFSSADLTDNLFKKYNVAVMPGDVMGKKGYIRLNLSGSNKDFNYLLSVMSKELKA